MDAFPRYWPFVRGIHWSSVNSPHKGRTSCADFDVFYVGPLKLLNKQSNNRWFETYMTFMWRHRNVHAPVPTRTTRTPAFWGYPPPPNDYPYHWVILDPKSKDDKVKVTNFKKNAKILNFWIFKRALHATHLQKLLDKMCKYEMDPMSIVEDTERTRFYPQTDRRTAGQGDTSIPPFQLRWSGVHNETTPEYKGKYII